MNKVKISEYLEKNKEIPKSFNIRPLEGRIGLLEFNIEEITPSAVQVIVNTIKESGLFEDVVVVPNEVMLRSLTYDDLVAWINHATVFANNYRYFHSDIGETAVEEYKKTETKTENN